MPIKTPGHRNRRGKALVKKRSAVAVLQLTAMVDMFTVLAVFLLQNYATTGEIIHIPKDVVLPKAGEVKELKPANIVTISENEISFNQDVIIDTATVAEQQELMIQDLLDRVKETIQIEAEKAEEEKSAIREAISKAAGQEEVKKIPHYKKMTIQSDKKVHYKLVKKIMFTVTEAGIAQINFAVMKNEQEQVN